MSKHDAVVILGSRPVDPVTWAFPSHIYTSLDRAAKLYMSGQAKHLIVSGKWTINFDVLHIQQPFRECDAMAEYLISKGVPDAAIFREAESKDTISNIYFIKRELLQKYNLHRLHFIAAEARLERIAFLCTRILGPDYATTYEGVPHKSGEVSPNEARTLRVQSDFLAPMQDGRDEWLDGRFFTDPFYDTVRARVLKRANNEPFLHLAKLPRKG